MNEKNTIEINAKELGTAKEKLQQAEATGLYPDVLEAREAISSLIQGKVKEDLVKRINEIPYREKISNIKELENRGLYIIEDDVIVVNNNIIKILKEKELLISDLAKLTGISRQNINAVVKNKLKPGVDFALKVSHVLGITVEELFVLTESAWVKPYKRERDSTLYVNIISLEVIDNTVKKQNITENGYEYYDRASNKFLTKEEKDDLQRQYVNELKDMRMNQLRKEYADEKATTNQLNSMAIEELKDEFNQNITKIYKKLGEKIQPYVIH